VAGRAAVIGAGPMGLWLTKYLKARGYGVVVYDRNRSRARAAANVSKTDMAKTLDEAVGEAELTVLAVGAENAGPLLSGLLKRYSGKVYVDISSVKAPILKFLPETDSELTGRLNPSTLRTRSKNTQGQGRRRNTGLQKTGRSIHCEKALQPM
jgi:prephenate dehydrogenase